MVSSLSKNPLIRPEIPPIIATGIAINLANNLGIVLNRLPIDIFLIELTRPEKICPISSPPNTPVPAETPVDISPRSPSTSSDWFGIIPPVKPGPSIPVPTSSPPAKALCLASIAFLSLEISMKPLKEEFKPL